MPSPLQQLTNHDRDLLCKPLPFRARGLSTICDERPPRFLRRTRTGSERGNGITVVATALAIAIVSSRWGQVIEPP